MCVCVCLGVLLREPGAGRETTLIAPAVHACPTVWLLVGNGGCVMGTIIGEHIGTTIGIHPPLPY